MVVRKRKLRALGSSYHRRSRGWQALGMKYFCSLSPISHLHGADKDTRIYYPDERRACHDATARWTGDITVPTAIDALPLQTTAGLHQPAIIQDPRVPDRLPLHPRHRPAWHRGSPIQRCNSLPLPSCPAQWWPAASWATSMCGGRRKSRT